MAVSQDEILWETLRQWPEFIALANRLGISNLENTEHLDIHAEQGMLVTIVQRIMGKDCGAQVKTADT